MSRYSHDEIHAMLTNAYLINAGKDESKHDLGVIVLLADKDLVLKIALNYGDNLEKAVVFDFARYIYAKHNCYAYGLISEAFFSPTADKFGGLASRKSDVIDALTLVSTQFDNSTLQVVNDAKTGEELKREFGPSSQYDYVNMNDISKNTINEDFLEELYQLHGDKLAVKMDVSDLINKEGDKRKTEASNTSVSLH